MPKPSLYFFYRTPYEDLLSRRLIKLETSSILEWFQLGWEQAMESDIDLYDWVNDQCSGRVYGLASIFQAARENKLDRPQTWQQLHDLLSKHLHVQGRASECIQMDAKSLRVKTDDDESDVAYYFIETGTLGFLERTQVEVLVLYDTADLGYVETIPLEVQYLFTDFEDLQERASESSEGAFEPAVKVKTVMPKGDKTGALYGCFLTFYDSASLDLEGPFCIPGIRLEDTIDYLRTVNPCTGPERPRDKERLSNWPRELRWLRGFIDDADTDLVELFQRAVPWMQDDTPSIDGPRDKGRVKLQQHIEAQKKKKRTGAGDSAKSRHIKEDHFFLFCGHQYDGWGGPGTITYFQLFLFDDLWASANSSLANSILRYSKHWDPFHSRPNEEE